jgi:type I restriction enzyme M protein
VLSIQEIETGEIITNIVNQLVTEYKYPLSSIHTVRSVSQGKARFVLDIIVQLENSVEILVEVTRKDILPHNTNQFAKVLEIMNPSYFIITNGKEYQYYKTKEESYEIILEKIPDIPAYQSSLQQIGKYDIENLVLMSQSRFKNILWSHVDLLRGENFGEINSIKYLLTIYAAKMHDEQTKRHEFRAGLIEVPQNISSRIISIINDFYAKNPHIPSVKIPLASEIISKITFDIQKFNLSKSIGLFNSFIPTILNVYNNIGQRNIGEYSTPEKISRFIIDILDPKPNETLLDPASGVGGFLQLAAQAGSYVTGFDISRDACQISNLILFLSGYPGKCHNINSLSPDLSHFLAPGVVNLIATAPPFGNISTTVFDSKNNRSSQTRRRMDLLFLELSIKLLNEGGRAAIVLQPSVLFDSISLNTRKNLLQNTKLNAIIYLDNKAFHPLTSVNSCILFFEKKKGGTTTIDDVFFGKINHDNDYDPVSIELKKFLNGQEAKEKENIIITRVKSAENLDWGYIKGRLNLLAIEEQNYYYLDQIADIITGISLKRLGYENRSGEYSYINVKNIDDGLIDISRAVKVPLEAKFQRYVARKGDLIFSRSGSVGKVAIVSSDEKLVVGNNLMIISPREESVPAHYILGYLMSEQGQEQIEMYTTGSAISTINSSNLGKIRIPIFDQKQMNMITETMKYYLISRNDEIEIFKQLEYKKRIQLRDISRGFERRIT